MRVDRFPLILFGPEKATEYKITVPEGSRFLKALAFNDGIYAYYEIPELQVSNFHTDVFFIPGSPQDSIPDGYMFIDIITVIVQTKSGEATLVLVIYKK